MRSRRILMRLAHLRRLARGGHRNYWWIVKGLPRSELLRFHYVLLALGQAVMLTSPEQTDLTALKRPSAKAQKLAHVANGDIAQHRERVEWLLTLARLILPGAQCLPTAIAAWWVLGDENAFVQVGIRSGRGTPFAHAWTVSNGRPTNADSFASMNVYIPAWRSDSAASSPVR